MTIIRVIDLETRGLLPDDGVVEIATVDLIRDGDDERSPWQRGRMWRSFVNPGKPIGPEVQAIHHIGDADVKDAPTLADVMPEVLAPGEDGKPPSIFAAHRASFERQFLDALMPPETKWICSWRVGVTCYPDASAHSNQALRYFLKLNLDPALAMPPHRAQPDAYVTAAIIRRMFSDFVITVDDMVNISSKPILLPRLHFGQHAGKAIEDVPTSYLEWMSKQDAMDPDALYTARAHLHDRKQQKSKSAAE